MRTRLRGCMYVACVLLVAGCAHASLSSTGAAKLKQSGYHIYWAKDAWTAYPLDALDELYFFEIEAARDGALRDTHGWPASWESMRRAARDAGVPVTPTITMHDAGGFDALFSSDDAANRLVDNLERLVRDTRAIGGIQLDFEVFQSVSNAARNGYVRFVEQLHRRMKSVDRGLALSVFVLAFDLRDAYDELQLARASDYLVVQGYDYHSAERSGPTAPINGWGRFNWVNAIARFDSLGVSRHQIVMSIPLYGYEWSTESEYPGARPRGAPLAVPLSAAATVLPGRPRALERIARYGSRRDSVSGSPYYVFRDSTGWKQGWYEDRESLAAKVRFAELMQLRGIAWFPLAYGDRTLLR